MSGTIITVSKNKLSDANAFIKEVKDTFNSTIPPVGFEISSREEVEEFANLFKSTENGYYGKKISCKSANSYAPSNFTASEIFCFKEDKYPIELYFKSIANLEDFAVGYMKAVETLPAPEPETSVLQSLKEQEKKDVKSATPDLYDVNPFAEKFMDIFLKIHLILGWLFAIFSVVGGIVLGINNYSGDGPVFIIVGIFVGVTILLSFYSTWAVIKVVINMSRNLYNINERLKHK